MKLKLFLLWTLLLMFRAKAKEQRQSSSAGVVDARLVNGPRRCSGHLEMKHQGQWRPLSSSFSQPKSFAELACRQMGCGSLVSYKLQANTTVTRAAWEVNFPCLGGAETIRQCREAGGRQRVEDVEASVSAIFVECSEYLRVVGSFSYGSCDGSVLVRSGQNWSHVCEAEAPGNQELALNLMCADVGCGAPAKTRPPSHSTEEIPESRVVRCHGNETRIEECPTTAHGECRRVLHLSCQEPHSVRVVGSSRCRGVVEGKDQKQWRPLRHYWSRSNEQQSMDLCRVLGCGTIISSTGLYLEQDVPLWETAYECHRSTKFCRYWTSSRGQTVMDIACTESVRLADGPNSCSGFVEVKLGNDWRHLCHDGFSPVHSFVGCRDLGCGFPQRLQRGKLTKPNGLRLNCSGHEEQLVQCPESSGPAGGSHEECNTAVLTCGRSPTAPTLSLFSRLGDVRDREIAVHRGHRLFVSCGVDSPSRVRSFRLSFYRNGDLEQWQNQTALDNKAQFVFESVEPSQSRTYFCSYNYEFKPDVFSEHARFYLRVKDSSYVRLVGAQSRCLGLLELQWEGEWRPLSQRRWGPTEAAVVCEQLLCGSVISTDTQDSGLQPVWSFFSDCEGSDAALLDCGSVREGLSHTTVHVLCSDILDPPIITVLADKLYPNNTDHVIVREGHTFFLNCTVKPAFPGGHFSLGFSGSKTNLNLNKAEMNHSAVFTFSQVSKGHSGNYSCFYHNTVSQHEFTFESKSITVTVQEFGDVMLDDGRQREDSSRACSGTLLLTDGSSQMKMVTAESSGWNTRHASIVCRRLSCGEALSTSRIQLQTFTSTWRFFSDCDGSEAALLDCGHIEEWFSSSVVHVECAGNN